MPCWRDHHSIALILCTILQSIDCVYLQLPGGNPPFGRAKSITKRSMLYSLSYDISWVCFFHRQGCSQLCWMVAKLGQPEIYSVFSEMHEVWAAKVVCIANATPSIINCPHREYWILSQGLWCMRCLVVVEDEGWAVLCSLTTKTCCTVACARVVECARAYAKVCLLCRVTRHVASI